MVTLIIALTAVLTSTQAAVDDLSISLCSGATSCSTANYNSNDSTSIGHTISKGESGSATISDTSFPSGASIKSVIFEFRHGGGNGISGSWSIDFMDASAGTVYGGGSCFTGPSHTSSPSYLSGDFAGCTSWTKAKLDDLRIDSTSGDQQGPTDAYIYWMNIIVEYDASPPLWRNLKQNKSRPQSGEAVNLAAQAKDTYTLSDATLATNESGSWQNKTGVYGSSMSLSASGAWEWSNFTWSNSSVPSGTTVGWKIWYNDTEGFYNSTDVETFTVNPPPAVEDKATFNSTDYSDLKVQTDFLRSDKLSLRANVTDAGLDNVWLRIRNESGMNKVENVSMTNISAYSNGGTYEYNYSVPDNAEIGDWSYTIYANDTTGLESSTPGSFSVYVPAYLNVSFDTTKLKTSFYSQFNITANVTCESDNADGECGMISGGLRFNDFDIEPDSIISPFKGTTPFFVGSFGKTGVETQAEWNNGTFNSTSADRKDNSGTLGLGYANGTASDNLKGYWRFDRTVSGTGGTALDYSGNGNNGVYDGATTGVSGLLSTKGVAIDTKRATINVTDNPAIDDDLANGFTLNIWANFQPGIPDSGLGGQQRLVVKDTDYDLLVNPTGNLRLDNHDTGGFDVDAGSYNGWVMLTAVVSSSGNGELYKNGTLLGTGNFPIDTMGSANDLQFGNGPDLKRPANATIDEVRLYNRTLSASEIQRLYFEGEPFQGNYTSAKVDTDYNQTWKVHVDANLPSDTEASIFFKGLDSSESTVGTEVIDIADGANNYTVETISEDAQIIFNGTSTNASQTWEISSFKLYHSTEENPQSCSQASLKYGQSCSLNWTVNATEKNKFNLDANFSSDASWIKENDTDNKLVNVDTGWLDVSLLSPLTDPFTIGQNNTFWLNASAVCKGDAGDVCGLLSGGARYISSGEPNELINSTEGATPFFVPSGSKSFSVSNQRNWTSGAFNGTSADRKYNSGTLGLGYRNGTLNDNLVGYWRFDEENDPLPSAAYNVTDFSGEGINASSYGGTTRGKRGVFGTNSFNFDGTDDYVSLGNHDELDVSGSPNFTISMWMRWDGGNSGSQQDIVHLGSYSMQILLDSAGDLYFQSLDSGFSLVFETIFSAPAQNQWYHVAGTYNGTHGVLYINGTQVDISTSSGSDIKSDGGLDDHIGQGRDSDGFFFSGKIDEFRFYNRTLSASEVEQLYFHGRTALDQFEGNYTSKKIDRSDKQAWNSLKVNTSIPAQTQLDAVFQALDSAGSVVDSQIISMNDGYNSYALDVSDSEDAEIIFNGTSDNVTKTWEVHNFTVKTPSGGNPVQCSSTLSQGQSCQLNWSVNATGSQDTSWNLDVNFTSDKNDVVNDTDNNEVCIGSCGGDLTPPNITIHNPLNATISDSTPWLNVTANESVDTWKYNVDNNGNSSFSPNITLSSLSNGQHNVTVWANDSAGNYGVENRYFKISSGAFYTEGVDQAVSSSGSADGSNDFDEDGSENLVTSLFKSGTASIDLGEVVNIVDSTGVGELLSAGLDISESIGLQKGLVKTISASLGLNQNLQQDASNSGGAGLTRGLSQNLAPSNAITGAAGMDSSASELLSAIASTLDRLTASEKKTENLKLDSNTSDNLSVSESENQTVPVQGSPEDSISLLDGYLESLQLASSENGIFKPFQGESQSVSASSSTGSSASFDNAIQAAVTYTSTSLSTLQINSAAAENIVASSSSTTTWLITEYFKQSVNTQDSSASNRSIRESEKADISAGNSVQGSFAATSGLSQALITQIQNSPVFKPEASKTQQAGLSENVSDSISIISGQTQNIIYTAYLDTFTDLSESEIQQLTLSGSADNNLSTDQGVNQDIGTSYRTRSVFNPFVSGNQAINQISRADSTVSLTELVSDTVSYSSGVSPSASFISSVTASATVQAFASYVSARTFSESLSQLIGVQMSQDATSSISDNADQAIPVTDDTADNFSGSSDAKQIISSIDQISGIFKPDSGQQQNIGLQHSSSENLSLLGSAINSLNYVSSYFGIFDANSDAVQDVDVNGSYGSGFKPETGLDQSLTAASTQSTSTSFMSGISESVVQSFNIDTNQSFAESLVNSAAYTGTATPTALFAASASNSLSLQTSVYSDAFKSYTEFLSQAIGFSSKKASEAGFSASNTQKVSISRTVGSLISASISANQDLGLTQTLLTKLDVNLGEEQNIGFNGSSRVNTSFSEASAEYVSVFNSKGQNASRLNNMMQGMSTQTRFNSLLTVSQNFDQQVSTSESPSENLQIVAGSVQILNTVSHVSTTPAWDIAAASALGLIGSTDTVFGAETGISEKPGVTGSASNTFKAGTGPEQDIGITGGTQNNFSSLVQTANLVTVTGSEIATLAFRIGQSNSLNIGLSFGGAASRLLQTEQSVNAESVSDDSTGFNSSQGQNIGSGESVTGLFSAGEALSQVSSTSSSMGEKLAASTFLSQDTALVSDMVSQLVFESLIDQQIISSAEISEDVEFKSSRSQSVKALNRVNSVFSANNPVNQSLDLSEDSGSILGVSRFLSQNAEVSGSVKSKFNASETLIQTNSVQSQESSSASFGELLVQSIGYSSSIYTFQGELFRESLVQTVSMSSSVEESASIFRQLEEGLKLDTSSNSQASWTENALETLSASELTDSVLNFRKGLTQSVGLQTLKNIGLIWVDGSIQKGNYSGDTADSMSVENNLGQSVSASSNLSDRFKASDTGIQSMIVSSHRSSGMDAFAGLIGTVGLSSAPTNIFRPTARISEIMTYSGLLSSMTVFKEDEKQDLSFKDSESSAPSFRADRQQGIGMFGTLGLNRTAGVGAFQNISFNGSVDGRRNTSVSASQSYAVSQSIADKLGIERSLTVFWGIETGQSDNLSLRREASQEVSSNNNVLDKIGVTGAATQTLSITESALIDMGFLVQKEQKVSESSKASTEVDIVGSIVQTAGYTSHISPSYSTEIAVNTIYNLGLQAAGVTRFSEAEKQALSTGNSLNSIFSASAEAEEKLDAVTNVDDTVSLTRMVSQAISYSSGLYGFNGELFEVGVSQTINFNDLWSSDKTEQEKSSDQSGGGGSSGGGSEDSGGSLGGLGGLFSKKEGINITPKNITVKLNPGDSTERTVEVTNIGDEEILVYNYVRGIEGFASFLSSRTWLGASESIEVPVSFSVPENSEAGVHNGTIRFTSPSDTEKVDTNVIVQTEEDALLDLRLDMEDNEIDLDESGKYSIELFNMGQSSEVDVVLERRVFNSTGHKVHGTVETLAVQTSASITREIRRDLLPEGRYKLEVVARYANANNQSKVARASKTFEVAKKRASIWNRRVAGVKIWKYIGVILLFGIIGLKHVASTGSGIYVCIRCGEEFSSEKGLHIHQAKKHDVHDGSGGHEETELEREERKVEKKIKDIQDDFDNLLR